MWIDNGEILFNLDTGCSVTIDVLRVGPAEDFSLTWKDKSGESEFVITVTDTAEEADRLLRLLAVRLQAWDMEAAEGQIDDRVLLKEI
jgi:hypothetical protein